MYTVCDLGCKTAATNGSAKRSYELMACPSPMTISLPVIYNDSSEHIHNTAPAISSGVPKRFMGTLERVKSLIRRFCFNGPSSIGVWMNTGHTAFIRMFFFA
jgi:hypothetical protein